VERAALMGAFDVRRGKLFGFASSDHNSLTFVDLLNAVDVCYPEGTWPLHHGQSFRS
jgi:hypothetical protein